MTPEQKFHTLGPGGGIRSSEPSAKNKATLASGVAKPHPTSHYSSHYTL